MWVAVVRSGVCVAVSVLSVEEGVYKTRITDMITQATSIRDTARNRMPKGEGPIVVRVFDSQTQGGYRFQ